MKSRLRLSKCLFVLAFLFYPDLYAQFHSLETKNLKLIYLTKAHEYVVPHLARSFENSFKFHSKLFDYSPATKITILLQDFGDYGNAGATALPYNRISVGIAPFSYVYETRPANERMNWLMNHELVHIIASDKSSGRDNFFRALFAGKVSVTSDNPLSMFYSYLTNPRWYSPRWYHEGIAVFMETWMAGGLGRSLGPYDEMVFRTMVRDGSYIYDIVGLESEGTTIDFQVGAISYLYGTRFMSYLAYQYSPEKLIDWVKRSKGSKPYFAGQFKKVFGNSLDGEWSQWIEFERRFQQANLDSIRLNPITEYRPVFHKALGSFSRAFFNASTGKLYAAIRYPGQVANIAAIDIDTGKIKKICDVKGGALYYVTSLCYDPATENIFYTTDNNRWRDLNVVNVKTRKSKRLIKDVRTGDLAFNKADSSIWGIRHYLGISTIVRIPYPYTEWKQIHSWPYGNDIFDLDISPDGKMLTAALTEISGRQSLIKMDIAKLLQGDKTYEEIFDFDTNSPSNFGFSPDGRWLFGSSYYSGVSNIFRYDFESKNMVAITNTETGYFRPTFMSEDSLIVLRYTGKGFVPVIIANDVQENVSAINFLGQAIVEKHPIVKTWIAGSPASIHLDSLTTYSGKYSSFRGIRLNSIYPVVEGYKDVAAIGLRFNFVDRLGLAGFDLTASYSPDRSVPNDERLHLGLNFRYWGWKISATYNGANFYDLFGPTKMSRKGYAAAVQYRKNLLFDEPRTMNLNLRLAGYGDLETLPDFQNISATFDKFLTFRSNLVYRNVRKSLGAVEEEKGFSWGLHLQSNYVNKEIFPQIYTDFDYGILLPLDHSSLWLRASAGQSFGDRDNPFANFFFGGFGNNWVDYSAINRYREYYSCPGVELNEIGGKNFAKVQVEWTLPPLRFRRFGFPSLYFRWARLTLFSSGILTNFDDKNSDRKLLDFGGQIDFRLVLFSSLNSTFSLGYGIAVEENRSPEKELMISLKIL
jgi:hypothetical protein